jgi:hypothetical protein
MRFRARLEKKRYAVRRSILLILVLLGMQHYLSN